MLLFAGAEAKERTSARSLLFFFCLLFFFFWNARATVFERVLRSRFLLRYCVVVLLSIIKSTTAKKESTKQGKRRHNYSISVCLFFFLFSFTIQCNTHLSLLFFVETGIDFYPACVVRPFFFFPSVVLRHFHFVNASFLTPAQRRGPVFPLFSSHLALTTLALCPFFVDYSLSLFPPLKSPFFSF